MSPNYARAKGSVSKALLGALLLSLPSLMVTAPLHAGVITYEEILEDLNQPLVFFDFLQNLQRTRTLGDGSPPVVTENDLVIQLQNAVSGSFGRWGTDPVMYSHVFQSVGMVDSFMLASLEILAASVSPTPPPGFPPEFFELLFGIGTPDDPVVVDGVMIGFLTPGHPFKETTLEFSTGDTALIALLLENDRIRVTITPMGPGSIGEPDGDKISVRSSAFQVTYQTQAVPEPGAAALLAAGLLAAGLYSKGSKGSKGSKARRRQVRLR